jgi:hypothetical protein
MEKTYRVEMKEKEHCTCKNKKASYIGNIMRGNCLLKHFIEGKIEVGILVTEDEEEDLSSNCMTLREREDTGN